jgi:hypothetical protein
VTPEALVDLLSPEVVGMSLGAILTIMTLSYIFGDNALYRFALHVFVGALVGYSLGILLRDVVRPTVEALQDDPVVVIPLVLGMLLIFKGFPKYAYVGNLSTAYLVGVGAAVALSGALLGTLIPQIEATGRILSPDSLGASPQALVNNPLILVGTILTLMAFNFAAPREGGLAGQWTRVVEGARWVGHLFLAVAFGAAFAGALTASLSIFIGRIQFLIDFITKHIIGGLLG